MTRTKLRDRELPDYTAGEERFNMISHLAGGCCAAVMLALCILSAAARHDAWAMASGILYGSSLVLLYAVSSLYHGLRLSMGKKVMQVVDHCTIYFLIAGTYTPVLLCAVRRVSPAMAWTLMGLVYGFAVLAAVLTAIDLKKYAKFSMACYIGIGWCIVIAAPQMFRAVALPGLALLLAGGLAYTVGAVLYAVGKKRRVRYMHGVFHLFVLAGSLLQFLSILLYVIPA